MAGPWGKYQSPKKSESSDGPWAKYRAAEKAEEPGFFEDPSGAVLRGVAKVGETIDKYGGAPTRAAISKLQDDVTEPGVALEAFKNQFGEDPKLAPTGKNIVRRAGIPDATLSELAPALYSETGEGLPLKKGGALDPSASGALGFGVDVVADPLNVIPIGAAAKVITGTLGRGAKLAGKAAKASSQVASKASTKVFSKVGNLMTGVPEKEIATYINKYPEVTKIIQNYGDDIPGAADKIREGFQNSVRTRRMALGREVGKALDALPQDKVVDIAPVIGELQNVKSRMNQALRLEEVRQVDELIERVTSLAGEGGKVSPKEMFDIKEWLQDRGAGAFMKDGQIFVPGKDAQIAAKNASREARKLVNQMSPTVANANQELSKLHVLEKKMNKNLIAEGKSDAALGAAGSGTNERAAKQLKQLGEITKTDMLGEAEKFSAAKRFASPGLTAADSTGKSVERTIKAGLVGQFVGGPVAAALAVGMTSPMALKGAIKAGRIPVRAVHAVLGTTGNLSDAMIEKAYQVLKTERGQRAFEAALQGAKAQSIDLKNVAESEEKGEAKWARSGLQKLGIQDRQIASELMKSKKGRKLLIEASDLKPESRALEEIKKQIERDWGKK